MSKVLLIIGEQGSGKTCAALVAKQIAEQHHGADVTLLDEGESRPRPRLTKPAPGTAGNQLTIFVKAPNSDTRIRAFRVINLAYFTRYPRGKALTFAIREAVDACLAAG